MEKKTQKKIEIEDAVIELYQNKLKIKDLTNQFEERNKHLQDIIQKYIKKSGSDYFRFLAKSGMFEKANQYLKVKSITPKKIVWDTSKLKNKLDKEVYDEIVEKQYTINDIEGLIEYLKSCGVNPRVFKSFIDVKENVNQKLIDDLGNQGVINVKSLKGCFEIVENTSYIKIFESEDEE